MRDKCFKCLEKGHYKNECTNQIVCFRCGLPGHGSKDCKRPRSPSSVDDLRREAVAKVARRSAPPPRPAPVAAPSGSGQFMAPQSAPRGVDSAWPPLAPPRLQVEARAVDVPAELCVVRRSAMVSDLERRLQFAMVAYVGGQRRVLAPACVKEILAGRLDIPPELMSVHCYRPEDFLVVFASAEVRNRVAACPSVEFEGDRLHFRPWNRQSQAVHSVFGFKVEAVAPETASRSDLSSFKLTAWTARPQDIPMIRWLAVPEPGMEAPPALLQYKVLIHIDMVMDLREAGEPWFFGSSSDSGQSGLPDNHDGDPAGGGPRQRRLTWQFGVPDVRVGGHGGAVAGEGGGAWSRPVGHDWRLPPMESPPVAAMEATAVPILSRLTRRLSAFKRLTGQANRGASISKDVEISNETGGRLDAQLVVVAEQVEEGRSLAQNPSEILSPRPQGHVATNQREEVVGTCAVAVQSGALMAGPQVTAPEIPVAFEKVGPILEQVAVDVGELGSQGREYIGCSTGADILHVAPRGGSSNLTTDVLLVDKQVVADPRHDSALEVLAVMPPGVALAVEAMQPADGHASVGALPDGSHASVACDPVHVAVPLSVHAERERFAEGPVAEGAKETCLEMVVTNDPANGLTPKEVEMYAKLKAFCSCIVKKLAPPILKEVQASTLRLEAEPFTPKRTTRATKKSTQQNTQRATPAENVLLRTLGIVPEDLQVTDTAVQELKSLFDSPLREHHVRVIAALFGKALPGQLSGASSGATEGIGAH
ncbi:hypothetical protein VPH35_078015 [Triticum aestivum]